MDRSCRRYLRIVCTLALFTGLDTGAHAGEMFDPKPAPTFHVKTLDGEDWNLEKMRGKWVLIEFWRRECSRCMLTVEKLANLRKDLPPEKVSMIGINCDKDIQIPRNFLRRKPSKWPQVHAKSQAINLIKLYHVKDLPSFCLIDPAGKLVFRSEKNGIEEIRSILESRIDAKSSKSTPE